LSLGTDNQQILPSESPSQGITHRALSTNALSELMKPIEHANRATQIHPPFVLSNAPSPFSPRVSEGFSNPSGQYGVNRFEKDPILVNNNLPNWDWFFDDAGLPYSDGLFSPSMVSLGNPITLERSIFSNPNESSGPFSSMGQDITEAVPNYTLSKISGPCKGFPSKEMLSDTGDMLKMFQKLNLPDSLFPRISEHHNQHVTASSNGAQKPERQLVNKMLVESLIGNNDEGQDGKLAPKNDDGASVETVSEMVEAAKIQTHVTDGECNTLDPKIFAILA
jgi:hypothetical protein